MIQLCITLKNWTDNFIVDAVAEHTVLHVMWRMQSGQLPTHQLMLSPVSAKSPGELEVSWEHVKMISLSETAPASVET